MPAALTSASTGSKPTQRQDRSPGPGPTDAAEPAARPASLLQRMLAEQYSEIHASVAPVWEYLRRPVVPVQQRPEQSSRPPRGHHQRQAQSAGRCDTAASVLAVLAAAPAAPQPPSWERRSAPQTARRVADSAPSRVSTGDEETASSSASSGRHYGPRHGAGVARPGAAMGFISDPGVGARAADAGAVPAVPALVGRGGAAHLGPVSVGERTHEAPLPPKGAVAVAPTKAVPVGASVAGDPEVERPIPTRVVGDGRPATGGGGGGGGAPAALAAAPPTASPLGAFERGSSAPAATRQRRQSSSGEQRVAEQGVASPPVHPPGGLGEQGLQVVPTQHSPDVAHHNYRQTTLASVLTTANNIVQTYGLLRLGFNAEEEEEVRRLAVLSREIGGNCSSGGDNRPPSSTRVEAIDFTPTPVSSERMLGSVARSLQSATDTGWNRNGGVATTQVGTTNSLHRSDATREAIMTTGLTFVDEQRPLPLQHAHFPKGGNSESGVQAPGNLVSSVFEDDAPGSPESVATLPADLVSSAFMIDPAGRFAFRHLAALLERELAAFHRRSGSFESIRAASASAAPLSSVPTLPPSPISFRAPITATFWRLKQERYMVNVESGGALVDLENPRDGGADGFRLACQRCGIVVNERRVIVPVVQEQAAVGVIEIRVQFDGGNKAGGANNRDTARVAAQAESVASATLETLRSREWAPRLVFFASFAALCMRTRETQTNDMKRQNELVAVVSFAESVIGVPSSMKVLARTATTALQRLCEAESCRLYVRSGSQLIYFGDSDDVPLTASQSGIAARVAESGSSESLRSARECAFAGADIDHLVGARTILSVAIRHHNQVLGVLQFINKLPLFIGGHVVVEQPFSLRDEQLALLFGTLLSACLRSTTQSEGLHREKNQFEKLLGAVTAIVGVDLTNSSGVKNVILKTAALVCAHDDAVLITYEKEQPRSSAFKRFNPADGSDLVLDAPSKLMEHVLRHGACMMIPDATKHPLVNPDVDLPGAPVSAAWRVRPPLSPRTPPWSGPATGDLVVESTLGLENGKPHENGSSELPRTKSPDDLRLPPCSGLTASLLASASAGSDATASTGGGTSPHQARRFMSLLVIPLMYQDGSCLGMLHLTKNDAYFSADDVEALETYCRFAVVVLYNSALLEFTVKAGKMASRLSVSLASRRKGPQRTVTVSAKEVSLVLNELLVSPSFATDVASRNFDIFKIRLDVASAPLARATRAALELFRSANVLSAARCSEYTLVSFMIALRDRYRHVPYHSWYHACDVLQTVHTMLFTGGVAELLQPLEIFTLLVSCLAHDVDHMGLNNAFHLKAETPLGILSHAAGSQSVLEVHHCNLTINLLDNGALDVFGGLDSAEEAAAYRMMVDCILATDMSKHEESKARLTAITTFDASLPEHRKLAMSTLLKVADISNVAKPFAVSRQWAELVIEEFSAQGDREKNIGVPVLPLFDREQNRGLAKSQIGFIQFVALPYFQATVRLFPGLQWLVDTTRENAALWAELQ